MQCLAIAEYWNHNIHDMKYAYCYCKFYSYTREGRIKIDFSFANGVEKFYHAHCTALKFKCTTLNTENFSHISMNKHQGDTGRNAICVKVSIRSAGLFHFNLIGSTQTFSERIMVVT